MEFLRFSVAAMRRKFSKVERTDILRRYGNSCVLCNKLFIVSDLHHIQFLSLGGPDATDNLVPLCPTCHRLFPHKFSNIITPGGLSEIASKKVSLAEIERSVINSLNSNPHEGASLLLSNSTLALILCFGAYARYFSLAQYVINKLSIKRANDRVLAAKLELFRAEMGLYLNSESDIFQRAKHSLSQLIKLTHFDTSAIARGNLILGRLAGRTGRDSLELRYLSNAYPAGTDDAQDTLEWQFRMLAYFKKHRQVDAFASLLRDVGELKHIEDEIIRSNIVSELGRVQLELGNTRDAIDSFREVLRISLKQFHSRGIFLTSLFLAECELMVEEYVLAAKHLLIASQFSSSSMRPSEHERLEWVRVQLEQTAGIDIFCDVQF